MKHSDLLNKTCLIGISYFDTQEKLLHQRQHSGRVIEVDEEEGISIRLDAIAGQKQGEKKADQAPVLHLPPSLKAWFNAPEGHYRNADNHIDINNPNYLVTWDVYKTKEDTPEGKHEWWEWVPRTAAPQVNSKSK